MGQFGVAVPGVVEHVGLRAQTPHETNWLVITDCSKTFNTVKMTVVVLAEVGNWVPALTLFVVNCYGARPAGVFFRMDSGENRMIPCSGGVQHGDPMGPAMFFLA